MLYHPVSRELTFHGVASVVTQFLLPLFADWTFASAELLPSVRPTTSHEPLDDPSVPEDALGRSSRRTLPVRPAPVPMPRSTPLPPRPPSPPPTHADPVHSLLTGLIAVCEANQVSIRNLTSEVHGLRQELARHLSTHDQSRTTTPSTPSPPLPPPSPNAPASGRLPPIMSCRRAGGTSPPCCAVGFCSEDCTSPRCPRHRSRRRRRPHRRSTSVVPPVGVSHVRRDGVRGSDPQHHRPQLPDHQLRPPPPRLSHEPPVGSLTTVTPMPATSSGSHGARLICRRTGCQEPVHPECTTSYCNMHCRSHRCTFHHYSPGNGRGATSVLTRTS